LDESERDAGKRILRLVQALSSLAYEYENNKRLRSNAAYQLTGIKHSFII
jgi:hypothetical protein